MKKCFAFNTTVTTRTKMLSNCLTDTKPKNTIIKSPWLLYGCFNGSLGLIGDNLYNMINIILHNAFK